MSDSEPVMGSRNIPDPIMREVRQRCGFGCVVCGLPLYEYDHLLGWANVHRHVADEIVLLCDQHHRERTNGLLTDAEVIAANSNPFNLQSDVSRPYDLHFSGSECAVVLGDNTFTMRDEGLGTMLGPIVIDNLIPVLFRFEDEHLLLTVALYDHTNRQLLGIMNNQLVYTVDNWDIEFVGRTLIVRAGQGDVFIEITFDPPNQIRFTRGRLLYNGVEVLLAANYAWLSNKRSLISGNRATGNFGLVIGTQDLPCAIRVTGVNRYLGQTPRAGHMAARKALADNERRTREANLRIEEMKSRRWPPTPSAPRSSPW